MTDFEGRMDDWRVNGSERRKYEPTLAAFIFQADKPEAAISKLRC